MTGRPSALALLVIPALLLFGCGSSATPAASSGASSPASPGGSGGSGGEELAATIPTEVGDVALTVTSGDLTALQNDIVGYAELVQRLQNADIEPSDVRAALGRPTAGGDDPTVGGLEVVGAPPGGLGLLGLMQAWTSSIPGATVENTNLGKPVTVVTFEDGSLPLYYYLYDRNLADLEQSDTLYFVRSADPALVQDALVQLP
jgi:hypothetical protein